MPKEKLKKKRRRSSVSRDSCSLKVVHTGDFHIGATFRGLRGSNIEEIRREDIKSNIVRIVDFALEKNVDLFLITGDVFHSTNVKSNDFVFFAEQIGKLTSNGTKVVIIAGNHDRPKSAGIRHFIEGLVKANAPNVFYFSKIPEEPLVLRFENKNCTVGIVPIPYVHPEIVKVIDEPYANLIRDKVKEILKNEKMEHTDIKILMAHLIVSGSRITKIPSLFFDDPKVGKDDIFIDNFDYVALGHIHRPQKIAENAYYSGSVERLAFSEVNEEKFFNFLQFKNGELQVEQVELPLRPMQYFDDVKILQAKNIIEDFRKILLSLNIQPNSVIKLILKAGTVIGKELRKKIHIIENIIAKEFNVKGWVIEISTESIIGDIQKHHVDVKANIKAKVMEYIDSLSVDKEIKKRAKSFAEKIIEEVGVY